MIRVRPATAADLPALRELIPRSARALSEGFYTAAQTESAIRYVFGPDTALIADNTYFLAESADGALAGCGGWSRRRTLYGGDQMKAASGHAADDLLDPTTDAARIRAFFIDPAFARRGVASAILTACQDAALAAGFRRLELAATLPGVPFYLARGFYPRTDIGYCSPRWNGDCVCADVRQNGNLIARPVSAPMSPPPEKKPPLFLNPFVQVAFTAVFGTAAEVLLKLGAWHTKDIPSSVPWLGLTGLLSGWTWLSILLTILSFLSWMTALRKLSLGVAFPLSNVVHVLIPLSCWIFLGEAISNRRWCGIALVVVGLLIVAKPFAKIDERL